MRAPDFQILRPKKRIVNYSDRDLGMQSMTERVAVLDRSYCAAKRQDPEGSSNDGGLTVSRLRTNP